MQAGRLRHVAPLFFVRDVVAASEYYVRALGFTQPPYWGDPPAFAMPERDGVVFMLKRAERGDPIRSNNPEPAASGGPWDAYVWVDDARTLHAEMATAGAEVAYGPPVAGGVRQLGIRGARPRRLPDRLRLGRRRGLAQLEQFLT